MVLMLMMYFDVHDHDDADHETDSDTDDDTDADTNDVTDDDTDDGGRGNRRPLPGGAVDFPLPGRNRMMMILMMTLFCHETGSGYH